MLTHSDEFNPEVMQATKDITYEDCGRRFKLADFANDELSSVSGRIQNWLDIDGSASGLNEPTIIGSGLADTGKWWRVEEDVVEDQEGPLTFIKVNNGPARGLGHIRMEFDEELHATVGETACFNGDKGTEDEPLCPAIGRIRHMGPLFDLSNDETGGLPITAQSEVAGPVGGFSWLMQLDSGSPKSLRIRQIEVLSTTPLVLALPYPEDTSFTITAHAFTWCSTTSTTHSCSEEFIAVDSLAKVRYSQGNTYFFDTTTKLLHVRIIMAPEAYTGDSLYSSTPEWRLWNLDDPNTVSWHARTHAIDRFEFNNVVLPRAAYGGYLQIEAACNEGDQDSNYCPMPEGYDIQNIEVCPSGYSQVAYDKCCVPSSDPEECYDFTKPPTSVPTPPPTYDPSSDLIINGGFEEGLSPWYINTGNDDQIEIVENEVNSGTKAVLIKDRVSSWNGVQQNIDPSRVEHGATYRVSGYAKIKGDVASDSFKLTFRITTDVPSSSTHYWKNFGNCAVTNTEWTKCEGDITLDTPGTVITGLQLYSEGTATTDYYVDDVSAILVS